MPRPSSSQRSVQVLENLGVSDSRLYWTLEYSISPIQGYYHDRKCTVKGLRAKLCKAVTLKFLKIVLKSKYVSVIDFSGLGRFETRFHLKCYLQFTNIYAVVRSFKLKEGNIICPNKYVTGHWPKGNRGHIKCYVKIIL